MTKSVFAELYALGDGFVDAIYPRDEIVSRDSGTTWPLREARCHISDVEFRNSMSDRARKGQIRFDTCRSVALESRHAGSRVPRNHRL